MSPDLQFRSSWIVDDPGSGGFSIVALENAKTMIVQYGLARQEVVYIPKLDK